MDLQFVEYPARRLGFNRFVQGGADRSVEVIPHSGNALRGRVANIDQCLDLVRPLHRRPRLRDSHIALTRQGFKAQEQVTDTGALILKIILLRLAGLAG
jgi:hypothetical protein